MIYKFKQGFEIRTRLVMGAVFQAMGETYIDEETIFDVFIGNKKIGTRGEYFEALHLGRSTTTPMRGGLPQEIRKGE
jgi:hypothetical protein